MLVNQTIKLSRGFTVVELIIVMGMMVTLTGMVTISLLTSQRLATLSATIMTLESDIKQQQLKAMDGDISAGAPSNYGVHFVADKYTLFKGSSFDSSSDNFVVDLETNISLTTPGDLIFTKGSGESNGLSAITLQDTFNNHKTLTINSLGVITNETN
jgi:type II secretory pathway pseudopilin PulG